MDRGRAQKLMLSWCICLHTLQIWIPFEEFFAGLKSYIRRHWQTYKDNPGIGFDNFLEWFVDKVRASGGSAKGHFWHAGLTVEV